MGWIHPGIMLVTLCGGLYVLWLGYRRFLSLHLKRRISFNWKRQFHVGTLVVALWALGTLSGLCGAQLVWNGTFISGPHAWVGIAMFPLALSGYYSGHVLNKRKSRPDGSPYFMGSTTASFC